MSFALTSGVTGIQAHQKMLDVAGNNLANINTIGFKASRIVFSELLSETIKKASSPTATSGGANPQQMGSGVGVAGITPNMGQGNIANTGNPLDLALEGEGYFVVNDGMKNLYTRAGAFTVDAAGNMVDPATGYIVQRIGTAGESDSFQAPGVSDIKVPYDVAIPAKATALVDVVGNLSADSAFATPQINVMKSNIAFTTASGAVAVGSTKLSELSQFTANGDAPTGDITVSGYNHDGTALTDDGGTLPLNITIDANTTLDQLVAHINTVLSDDVNDNADGSVDVASLANGRIEITDGASGYSKADMNLTYSTAGNETLEMPGYFEITTVGGAEVKNANIIVYDSQGGAHVLSAAFVRTDTANTWDMVLTAINGDVEEITYDNRRISGIQFSGSSGSYTGLSSGLEKAEFVVKFGHDPSNSQTVSLNLGTTGQLNGLTQFASASTAVMNEQDGYESGSLASVSVSNGGELIGSFSNGIKKTLATLQIATFKNPAGLENSGNGYYGPSVNSGNAVATQAMVGAAGTIHSGALEKSNAEVAEMFVQMIEAQNGYQANARTIKVANEMLRELTNLIR